MSQSFPLPSQTESDFFQTQAAEKFYEHYKTVFMLIHPDYEQYARQADYLKQNVREIEHSIYGGVFPLEFKRKRGKLQIKKKTDMSLEHIIAKKQRQGFNTTIGRYYAKIYPGETGRTVVTMKRFIYDLNISTYAVKSTNTIRYHYKFTDNHKENRYCTVKDDKYSHIDQDNRGCEQFNHLRDKGNTNSSIVGYNGNKPDTGKESENQIPVADADVLIYDDKYATGKKQNERYIYVHHEHAIKRIIRAAAHARDEYLVPYDASMPLGFFYNYAALPIDTYEFINAWIIRKNGGTTNRFILMDPILRQLMNDVEYTMFVSCRNHILGFQAGAPTLDENKMYAKMVAEFLKNLLDEDEEVKEIVDKFYHQARTNYRDATFTPTVDPVSFRLAYLINQKYAEITSLEKQREDQFNQNASFTATYYLYGGTNLAKYNADWKAIETEELEKLREDEAKKEQEQKEQDEWGGDKVDQKAAKKMKQQIEEQLRKEEEERKKREEAAGEDDDDDSDSDDDDWMLRLAK